ncbi:MarR family winged helix-turn-helix transcriptional regulator [Rhodovulum sp. DZ06]|uniref:MarR family winged helix-turn-helix transcriptional regulator n=1 Tax=Rhodovulum sp. DZ06 TaxID=3425126 RepID=UPI003D33208D
MSTENTPPAETDFHLDEFLPYRLAVAAARVSRDFARLYEAEYGLSIPEWRVIAHLGAAEGAVSVREIHQKVDMDKSRVSRAAARLETAGYVTKSENAADRRLVSLRLTDEGRRLHAAIAARAQVYEAELLSRLPQEEARMLRACLDAVAAAV